MRLIKKDFLLYDVITESNKLLPVFNRFGIFLGFGDTSIEEMCIKKNINLPFLLEIVNTYNDANYFPASKLDTFSLLLIVDYLRKTHGYYLDFVLTDFEEQLNAIKQSSKGNKKEIELLNRFYEKYEHELLEHINYEDKNVFPYVVAIQDLVDGNINKKDVMNLYADKSISEFEQEHTNIEDKMHDLKNLMIKYLPPIYDQNLCNRFLFSLMRFEEDLADHARIEDKILIPKVKKIEQQIKL